RFGLAERKTQAEHGNRVAIVVLRTSAFDMAAIVARWNKRVIGGATNQIFHLLRRHRKDLLPINVEALRKYERSANMRGIFEADDSLLLDGERVRGIIEVFGEPTPEHLAAAVVLPSRFRARVLGDGLTGIGPFLLSFELLLQPIAHALAVLL